MTPEPLTPDERVIPPEMVEAAAAMEFAVGALAVELPSEVWEDVRDKWHAVRDAVAAGVPALIEDRDALIEERDRLLNAVIDVAIEQYHERPSLAGDSATPGALRRPHEPEFSRPPDPAADWRDLLDDDLPGGSE